MTAFIYASSSQFKVQLETINISLSEGKTIDDKLNIVDKKVNENVVAVFFKSIFGFYKRQNVDAIAQTFLKETIHHIKDLENKDIEKIASIFQKMGKQNNILKDALFEDSYNIPEKNLREVYKEIKHEFDGVQKQKVEISEKDKKIDNLNQLIKQKEEALVEQIKINIELQKSNEEALNKKDEIIQQKESTINEKASVNDKLKKELDDLMEKFKKSLELVESTKQEIITKDQLIKGMETAVLEQEQINKQLQSEMENLKKSNEKALHEKGEIIQQKDKLIQEKENSIKGEELKNKELEEKMKELQQSRSEIIDKNEKIINEKELSNTSLQSEIDKLKKQNKMQENEISSQCFGIKNLRGEIERLEKQVQKLREGSLDNL